jgi:hypothetical protein
MSLEAAIAEKVAAQVAPLLIEHLATALADPLLRPIEAANLLGLTTKTLRTLRLPKVHPTGGAARYRLSTIRAHAER